MSSMAGQPRSLLYLIFIHSLYHSRDAVTRHINQKLIEIQRLVFSLLVHLYSLARKDRLQLHSDSRFCHKMKRDVQFEQVFNQFDEDHDGKLSPSELTRCVGLIGGELPLKEAEAVVQQLDSDGDGLLSLEDFIRLMEGEGGEGEEEKMNELREAFGMYDMDGCGFITPKSLKRMLSRLGQKKSVDECRVMINQFDLNGDGVLSFDEFKVMML
ncbi:hypothetical protein VitviT2T_025693 [Vitis vinifera]|uniref:EF-hand domain-containing protein n=3 Tax=Vitis vinifera TaxID=29760 RepID=A5C3R8_VITVI|nr:putative calcium-binding protein CML19 [Vitis vinifera]RVX18152.1 Calcium-binding protein CML37 [Vitis vinifera]WKA07923.1 hypothetical protein VitviT2T_025693 [Vitis vinifera]CAN81786.1 hypothetical protein VITISV_026005 [Vitis vinifera]|eukprot:XP_010663735.1 PREDICTED: putative calcium-binding protein CML19 [Vitis vinifera]